MSATAVFPAEQVELRDGTRVQLRFLRPDDAERIKAFFYRLSPESIFYRLLEYRTYITDDEVRRLCDVDGQTRVAIAATRLTDGGEEADIIAVARYSLVDPATPGVAEAAIVVEDGFQHRGLGTVLMRRLVDYAQTHGIVSFVASIHANNTRILRFIERSGLRVQRQLHQGVWDFTIHLLARAPSSPVN